MQFNYWFLICSILMIPFFAKGEVKCFDQQPVKQNKLVYDYANILSSGEEVQLEQKLVDYNKITGSQIVIVAVNNVYCDISMSAINLGEDWGVGQSKDDNGIVFLVAKNDRKIFIATGNGIEEYVPDIMAHRIIENIIKPNFRQGNYYKGLNEATNVIQDLLTGAYEAPPEDKQGKRIPLIVVILFIIIVFWLLSRGGRGDGNQYDYNRKGRDIYNDDWGQTRGTWGDFRGGRGVFIPPSGGGFGGGGFGGFGGGSFGGGGAGGSW